MMRSELFLYSAVAAAALSGCVGPEPRSICDVGQLESALNGQRVRIQANGVFTRHGAYLHDSRCPQLIVLWDESAAFRGSRQSDALSSTALSEQFGQFRDIRVDVVGKMERRRGENRPRFIVERLFNAHPVQGTSRQTGPVVVDGKTP